ncbi:MAG: sulfatase-like hydrolase/transferase, partial [Planctomycetes bacterium]|nr:sulfatase-like hydrolase/transferase [Planctomycetota bacterium]
MPKLYDTDPDSLHPAVAAVRKFFNYDDYFDENKAKIARQAYYGLCSFVDHHIGQLLDTLEKNDLSQNTRVIYTSDHGDCLGERGIWAKSVMYESSVAIPLIMAGPEIPQKKIISTPVTHIDFYPTIIEGAG